MQREGGLQGRAGQGGAGCRQIVLSGGGSQIALSDSVDSRSKVRCMNANPSLC